jgi:hypothetical protein
MVLVRRLWKADSLFLVPRVPFPRRLQCHAQQAHQFTLPKTHLPQTRERGQFQDVERRHLLPRALVRLHQTLRLQRFWQ